MNYVLQRILGRTAVVVGSLSFALMYSMPSTAQESEAETGDSSFLVVGAGVLPEFEGSDDFRPVPFVVSRFFLAGTEIEIDGLQVRADFMKDSIWRAGFAMSVGIPRTDSVGSAAVAALPKVDLAAEFGGFVGFKTAFGSAKEGTLSGFVSVRQDVTGAHGGLLATPELEYFFAASRMLRFGLAANATYASNNYMDTYFSIDAEGSLASGLAEYQAGGGLKDVGAELYSILSFSPKWGVFSRVTYNRLMNDAADSPVIESRNQYFFGGGLFYRF